MRRSNRIVNPPDRFQDNTNYHPKFNHQKKYRHHKSYDDDESLEESRMLLGLMVVSNYLKHKQDEKRFYIQLLLVILNILFWYWVLDNFKII